MATCQTERWVSTAPYVKLIVEQLSSNDYQTTLRYTLQYISDSMADTSVAKSYSVTIAGAVVASGTYDIDGKSGTHQICTGTKVITETKSTQTISCKCGFAFNLTWSGSYAGTKSASTTISVGPKATYSIKYNANGGTGAPGNQTKWYGENITLSSVKPTRTGYTFQGWSTSSTATSASYASGATYSANSATTLYAVWKINTYTVSYNANGGTGAPSAQTKTYNVTLKLSSTKPTRTGYTFQGWSTTSTGPVVYSPGGNFTANSNGTLYAVWASAYVKPLMYNVSVDWDDYVALTEGDVEYRYAHVKFDWKTTRSNPTYNVTFTVSGSSTIYGGASGTLSGTSGNAAIDTSDTDVHELATNHTYNVEITLNDGTDSATVNLTLGGTEYPIDILAEGKGISFGGPASLEGVAHFQWDARFDKPVYGLVRGLGKLPKIEAGEDFDDYRDFGVWAVYANADSKTISNMPPLYYESSLSKWIGRAGILEVYSSTGDGLGDSDWSYIRQKFIPYDLRYPVMERDIARGIIDGETAQWEYGSWYKTSLARADTPVTLYSNNSGSASTITLSDSIDNYEYLEVFFTDNNGEKSGYTKMHKPYSGVINLSIVEAAGTNTYIRRTSYSFSGTTITPDVTNAGYLRVSTATASHSSGTNYIKITRVIGRNS